MMRCEITPGMKLRIVGNSVCHGFANGTIVEAVDSWSGTDFQAIGTCFKAIGTCINNYKDTRYWVRPCDVVPANLNSIRFKKKRESKTVVDCLKALGL